jgi:hypothetical protein
MNISFLQCGPSSLVDRYQQSEGTSQLQVQLVTDPKSYKMLIHVNQIPQHYVQEDSNIDMEFHCLRYVCVNKC